MNIPVLYSPSQTAQNPASFSPSAAKPAIVAAAFLEHGYPVSFHEPRPLHFSELCRAHDHAYVRGTLG